ncbi:MAG: rhomboid family intramembrane serine protease [candidate division WOR-3 bacterium]
MIPLKDDIESISKPIVTYIILILNIIVYLYEFLLGPYKEHFIWQFGAVPYEIFNPYMVSGGFTISPYLKIFFSMFIHANFMHILGNMIFLWVFSDNVEDRIGHFKYLFLYLIWGIAGVMLHSILSPNSKIPMVGASGAISGVLGAYVLFYPRARILALVPFGFFLRMTYIPSFFFIGIWFLYQFFLGLAGIGSTGGGVAYFAHIGGFIAGFLSAIPFMGRRRRREIDYEVF